MKKIYLLSSLVFLVVSVTQAQDLPERWESTDIGNVAAAGTAYFDNEKFYVSGSGADIYGTADAFHFVYQPSEGDCEITALVSSIVLTAPDAKACIMIRESLDTNAAFVNMLVTPERGIYFQARLATGAGGNSKNGPRFASGGVAPYWIKLTRVDTVFTGYTSVDGEVWDTIVGNHFSQMASEAYIGLAVTSHNNDGNLCESVFEFVEVESGVYYSSVNAPSINKLDAFPNPVKNVLTLKISEEFYNQNSTFSIRNVAGQLISSGKVNKRTQTINLSNIPQGIYYISLSNDRDIITQKIIKE
ncbi:MAG: T9SS type A sorting domain-containing protein [Bacteroidales bacterium]